MLGNDSDDALFYSNDYNRNIIIEIQLTLKVKSRQTIFFFFQVNKKHGIIKR